jgi:hypothetical protein
MWLLVRIDENWEPVIIGGYDTEQYCRIEAERSLWGSRVFCVPAKQRPMFGSDDITPGDIVTSPVPAVRGSIP